MSASTRTRHSIPFNRPTLVGSELEYILEAVSGRHLAGNGPFTERCERLLERQTGAARVLLTHSCTAALELAALLCDLVPGDEVIMPSFTFVSTANAFALRGARPVFVDVRPDTLTLDEELVEAAVSERTRVVVPVHYAGVACALGSLRRIADRHHLRVVEDAAQGLGATWQGRPLGTVGDLGCWSFHETKNVISGEGGALVVNDEALLERATIIRDKGTDRARFLSGLVDKYTWRDIGASFAPGELVAAFLFAQLEHAAEILARRRGIFARYLDGFTDLAARGLVQLPTVPADCRPNGHLFYLLVESEARRDALLAELDDLGINAVFHYVPLHESVMGQRLGYRHGQLPVTESLSRRLLRLPCYFELDEERQQAVIDGVRASLLGSPPPRRRIVALDAGHRDATAEPPPPAPELSVVSPVYRAEAVVGELVRRIRLAVEPLTPHFEIVLVDDGSPDASWSAIAAAAGADPRVKGVRLSRNFGQHLALTAGLDVARGRFVAVMDCDLQDDPEDIAALYAKAREGFEVVYGVRRRRAHPAMKNLLARAYFAVQALLTPGAARDPHIGMFSLLGRRAVDAFRSSRQVHRHYLEILDWVGLPAAHVPVDHQSRTVGRSNYSPSKLLRHAVDGIVSSSDRLLYVAVGSGLCFLLAAVATGVAVVAHQLRHGGAGDGWAIAVAVMLLGTAAILLSVGVVGIYVGKTFEQVRGRPLYLVRETLNTSDSIDPAALGQAPRG